MVKIEDEIKELAKQLKKNGVVKTEADALTLARNIIKTGRKDHKIIEETEKKEEKVEKTLHKLEEEKEKLKESLNKEEEEAKAEEKAIREEEKQVKEAYDRKFDDPSYDITKENITLKELMEKANKEKEKEDK